MRQMSDSWSARAFDGIAIFLSAVILSIPSFLFFPMMDGWSWFPLGDPDLLPYRDYFYPVTPLTFWEAQFAANFESPWMALRFSLLPLAVAYTASNYFLARLWINRLPAAVLTVFTAVLIPSLRLESLPGWNTQFLMLNAIGIALLIFAAKRNETTPGDSKVILIASLAGAAFSLGFLAKQTEALSAGLICGLLWILLIMRYPNNPRKSIFAIIPAVVMLLSTGLLFTWLTSLNLQNAFVADMLSGGGKNPTLLKFASSLAGIYGRNLASPEVIISLATILIFFLARRNYPDSRFAPSFAPITFTFITCVFIFPGRTAPLLFAGSVIIVLGLKLLNARFYRPLNPPSFYLQLAIILTLFTAVLSRNTIVAQINSTLITFVLLTAAYCFFVWAKDRISQRTQLRRGGLENHNKTHLDIATISVAGALINTMSSGGDAYIQWFISPFIIFCSWVMSMKNTNKYPITFFLIVASLLQGLLVATSPYIWYGYASTSLLASKSSVTYPNLGRLYIAEADAQILTEINKTARALISASPFEKLTVFSFPNVPGAAAVSGLEPYKGLRCFVQWFDVCPNSISQGDLKLFKSKLPSVVIWRDLTETEIRIHENAFLNERSALRKWQYYKELQVGEGAWKLVKRVKSSTTSNEDLEIFSVIR